MACVVTALRSTTRPPLTFPSGESPNSLFSWSEHLHPVLGEPSGIPRSIWPSYCVDRPNRTRRIGAVLTSRFAIEDNSPAELTFPWALFAPCPLFLVLALYTPLTSADHGEPHIHATLHSNFWISLNLNLKIKKIKKIKMRKIADWTKSLAISMVPADHRNPLKEVAFPNISSRGALALQF